jgi:hypothetical protein
MNVFDTINSIFSISPKEFFNITVEQLEEGKREETMRDRMVIIKKRDEQSRDKLRKKELQVYTRQINEPLAPRDPK